MGKSTRETKKYNCRWCYSSFDTQEDLHKHLAYLHGRYPRSVHKARKSDSKIRKLYLKKYPKNYKKIRPKSLDDPDKILMGNLESKDGVYIGWWAVWNAKTNQYDMYTSWGERIEYYKPLGSFAPVNLYKEYQKNIRNVSDDVLKKFS